MEIERRFLLRTGTVESNIKELSCESAMIIQGYFIGAKPCVRIRIVRTDDGDDASYITVKSSIDRASNNEFEYVIPTEDAYKMMKLYCGNRTIEKLRYYVCDNSMLWEVDFFGGAHSGLVIAEVEIDDTDQDIVIPEWVGLEITGNGTLGNYSLALQSENYEKIKKGI